MALNFFGDPPPGLNLSESRTASDLAIVVVLFILSLFFVLLRVYTRLRLVHKALALDDYLMFLGLAFNVVNVACCIVGELGFDRRKIDVRE